MTFAHFIVTRFNLPLFQSKGKGQTGGNLDPKWLDERFRLFERYCLPSVKGQVCQDFHWLILFDSLTSQSYRDKIESLSRSYPRMIPCYVDCSQIPVMGEELSRLCEDYDIIVEKAYPGRPLDCDAEGEKPLRRIVPLFLRQVIDSRLAAPVDWILTTRLDSDDAIHKDFISAIQHRFKVAPDHKVIDFVNTFKYICSDEVAFSYPLVNGHYITLSERYDGVFQSVLFWNHLYVSLFLPVDHVYRSPLQLEVIHGGNVVNDFSRHTIRGMIDGLLRFKPKDFNIRGLKVNRWRTCVMLLSLLKKNLINRFFPRCQA